MRRDMDLVRRIALETSELGHGQDLRSLPDVDPRDFAMHVIWMQEAGLLKAVIAEYMGGEPSTAIVDRLTWAGCEFADAVRSDTLWKAAKDKVLKPSASWSFSVLLEWVKTEIREGLPSLRGGG